MPPPAKMPRALRHPRRCVDTMATMTNALVTVLSFLVTVGLLVVVHEYGHYLVARLAGV